MSHSRKLLLAFAVVASVASFGACSSERKHADETVTTTYAPTEPAPATVTTQSSSADLGSASSGMGR